MAKFGSKEARQKKESDGRVQCVLNSADTIAGCGFENRVLI